ncbi:cysteine-rich CWC family protein [Azomonas macrocytogenes]|uniref:cysteine-rich CWC family protein n=1 Tax=Azomonas macrocytogenes TaxID=69962 RepID=UPI001606B02C|nr:cysteine-rich CWC family protein [Azomonas macrocytogenes]
MIDSNATSSLCPVCGKPNDCAYQDAGSNRMCWCFSVTIKAESLRKIPESVRGKACLCRCCAQADPASNE